MTDKPAKPRPVFRPPDPTIEEYGGGPIARMTPTKQDEAINKVFAGQKFEDMESVWELLPRRFKR